MRKQILTLTTICALIASLPAEATTPTKRELKIEAKIKSLNEQLKRQEQALEQERALRSDVTPVDSVALADEAQAQAEAEAKLLANQQEVSAILNDPTIFFNTAQIDSLLNIWKEVDVRSHYDDFFNQYISIEVDDDSKERGEKLPIDSLYKERLLKLASPIQLSYNSIVRSYINKYVSPKSNQMKHILSRSSAYFPDIEEALIKAGLPIELRAMAIIESALNAKAVSASGASGLWQFMPATGAGYGLEINSLVDERCDPAKSTVAACRFMADLYRMYGDWTLAIAAYNCGPGNVNKAIARSGLKEGTFWDIYYYLPTETRGYVPAFIGASYAYAYHREHDIVPYDPVQPLATDTVTVRKILHLAQVADVLDLSIDVLRQLNPQYRRDIIPATTKSYSLTLPQSYVTRYIESEEQIHAKDAEYLKEYVNPRNIEKLLATPHNRIHTVRSGETLSGIAQKYRVTTRQLMTWNKLKSANKLSVGQKLKVSN
ncbi:MAG: transglycosylase SLT domain-containing protein [Rikenellaceae bacterium]